MEKKAATKRVGVSRQMVRRAKARRRTQVSSIELLVQQWLTEAKIPFKTQYPIGLCHVDLFLAPKLVIEVNGCYYHNCPECQPNKTVHNKKAHAKDRKRYTFLQNAGYRLLLLWEHELTPDNQTAVLRKIKKAAGMKS